MSPSTPPRPVRPRYVPALDGIRALAVVAVVLYHLDFGVARRRLPRRRGLLRPLRLPDHHPAAARAAPERRSIGLQAFWNRRAHRLLPAVMAMIAVVCGISALFHAADLVHVPGRRARQPAVRPELVGDRRPPAVLRAVRPALAVHAPLVAGDRGAVLPAVAARPRRCAAVPEQGEGVRADARAGRVCPSGRWRS